MCSFLNQDDFTTHFTSIVLKDDVFHLQFISNAKSLFSYMVSLKNHIQVCLYKKRYQYALLFSFAENPPFITTVNYTGEQIYSLLSKLNSGFDTKLRPLLGVVYWKISDLD